MKKTILLSFIAMTVIALSCQKDGIKESSTAGMSQDGVVKSNQSGRNFTVHLSGDNEVPAVMTNATGEAIFKLSSDGTELQYKLIVANIEDVLMSHIHMAPEGTTGPVVVWLYPSGPPPIPIPGTTNGILAQGVITSANLIGPLAGADLSDLVSLLQSGGAYVNVHTAAHPGGEIRGQF